jgi:hypothetical protein
LQPAHGTDTIHAMRRIARSLAALTLFGVLLLGSACHFWHHLTDPGCDAGRGKAQPCATCSALHGGSVVADPEIEPLPDHRPATEVAFAPFVFTGATTVIAAAPRGPPAA